MVNIKTEPCKRIGSKKFEIILSNLKPSVLSEIFSILEARAGNF